MLNVVVAMQPEADPLLSLWQLKKVDAPSPVFSGDNINLIVSGIGKTQASAATAWLAAFQRTSQQQAFEHPITGRQGCWINVGIAGHSSEELGQTFIAHKVHDYSTTRTWYPTLIKPPIASSNLTTFDKPQTDYLDNELHDMEASGFIETARRFAHAEFVHCVKIVSDNKNTPHTNITPATARQLIAENTESITKVSKHLLALHKRTCEIPSNIDLDNFLSHWQFSKTQSAQLNRLVARYAAFDMPLLEIPESVKRCSNASQVINILTQEIDRQALLV